MDATGKEAMSSAAAAAGAGAADAATRTATEEAGATETAAPATMTPSSSSASAAAAAAAAAVVIYALDLDGVLVDSARETALSGLLGAGILWPHEAWVREVQADETRKEEMVKQFHLVRPILYVGWEAILIVRLLCGPPPRIVVGKGDVQADDDDDVIVVSILRNFHSDLKGGVMASCGLTESDCAAAFREARNTWIGKDGGLDWFHSHSFFDGACRAVRRHLDLHGNENVYVITTKAKDFAGRLLEAQGLYGDDLTLIKTSNLYGLGSGPKADVLQEILRDLRGADGDGAIAVMVEDNVATLQEIMESPVRRRVLPVVAAWGYNTTDQLEVATEQGGYWVLSETDSASLSQVLDDVRVKSHFHQLCQQ